MINNRMKSQRFFFLKKKKEAGSLMVEMALYLAISMILLATQFSKISQDLESALSTATGQYLVELQSATNKYVLANAGSLTSNPMPASFVVNGVTFNAANMLKPSIADLVNAGYFVAGITNQSPLGLKFSISLVQTGSCPGITCNVTGYAVSTTPYKDATGALRTDVLADALRTIGIDGGASYSEAPGTLRGFGGTWSAPNPTGDAGRLAIRVGSDSGIAALLAQFYKLDGTRPLAGAMNANLNDINNVGSLNASVVNTTNLTVGDSTIFSGTASQGTSCNVPDQGKLRRKNTNDGLVLCNGGVWTSIGNAIFGVSSGTACSVTGQLGTDPVGVAYICNGTTFDSLLTFKAAPGASCSQPGVPAISTVDGQQLICKGTPPSAVFQKLLDLTAKTVEYDRLNVQDKNFVALPACSPGGTPGNSFDVRQSLTDMGVIPPRQLLVYGATLVPGGWIINIKLKDDSGASFGTGPIKDAGDTSPNAPYNLTAVFRRECTY